MHAPCIFMPLLNDILVGGKHVASGAQSRNPVASPCVPVSFPSTDVPDVLPVCHNLVMVSHVMSTSISFQFHSKLIPIWFPFRPCPATLCPKKGLTFTEMSMLNTPFPSGDPSRPCCQELSGTWMQAALQMQTLWRSLTQCPSCEPEIRTKTRGALDHHPFKNGVWHGPHNFCGFFNEWNLVQYLDGGRCRRVKQRCQKWTWTWKRMDMPQKWVWNNRKY